VDRIVPHWGMARWIPDALRRRLTGQARCLGIVLAGPDDAAGAVVSPLLLVPDGRFEGRWCWILCTASSENGLLRHD
jgi:hypothetical protein